MKKNAKKPKQKKCTEAANKAQDKVKDEEIAEFAGNASTCLPDYSDLSSPLQLDANFD